MAIKQFMHICCKVGGFVGEICESGRFMSPSTWETSSKREIGPKRGSLPPKMGGLTGMVRSLVKYNTWSILPIQEVGVKGFQP